ncbi:S8 family serine peptidase [Paraflavisolibacter sp. H34]|uniref:S8 family serine peptidase n=1 Tax=Huijunlia imazamoxiresistens TaxID=3127457 RepID=UPI0030170075
MKQFRHLYRRTLFPAVLIALLFTACRKDLAPETPADTAAAPPSAIAQQTRQPEPSRYRPNEALLILPEDTRDEQRKVIEAILRQKYFPNLRVAFTRCICDPNIITMRGRGIDPIVDSLIINGPGSKLSPTSTTVGVSGPGNSTTRLILSKNLLFRNGTPSTRLPAPRPFAYTGKPGKVRLAVIDTGLDTLRYFPATTYARFLLPASPANYHLVGITNPALMNRSRFFGWNFIRNNQDIMDDNAAMKHGTHVTGLVLQQTPELGPAIIPLKAFDATGNAALSDLACALRFAELARATVVNASWGYYGKINLALQAAIRRLQLKNILLVAAAGNDYVDLTTFPHYPASFSKGALGYPNIITVTSATSNGVCGGNNFSRLHVDAAVSGRVNVSGMLNPFSGIPAWLPSCTSFSTAALTGIILRHFYAGLPTGGSLKENVLVRILPAGAPEPALVSRVRTGKRVAQ